ncbi:MAG: metallophosphoesterase [Eubacteriales bacterium]|nr:metallophosphoesterase [Eubacteriales bacterium]
MKQKRNHDPNDTDFLHKRKNILTSRILVGIVGIYSDIRIAWIFTSFLRWFILGIALLYSVFSLLLQAYSINTGRYFRLFKASAKLSGLYVAFLIYHLTGIFAADIFWLLTKHWITSLLWHPFLSALALAEGIIVSEYGRRHALRIKTTEYRVRIPKWKDKESYRIVQLSDLHIGSIIGEDYIRKTVRQVNQLKPDLAVITGDIFNQTTADEIPDYDAVFSILSEIEAPDGLYVIRGNHDPEIDSIRWQDFLCASGAEDLDNRCLVTDKLNLVGRGGLAKDPYRTPLRTLLSGQDPTKPTVVLDHDPAGIPEAEKENADLILCGHTHDGQFFPCNYFIRYWYGKAWSHGLCRNGNTISIVSSGTGFFQTPVRVGTDSEIAVIGLTGTGKKDSRRKLLFSA